jgi:hypothetical protein
MCIYTQEGNQRSEKASFISVYINFRLLTEVSSYCVTELKPRAFRGGLDSKILLGPKWCTQQTFLQKRDKPYIQSCLNDAKKLHIKCDWDLHFNRGKRNCSRESNWILFLILSVSICLIQKICYHVNIRHMSSGVFKVQ